MLLALVCLWVGFIAGFICAALMRRDSDDATARPTTERSLRHSVTRYPLRRRNKRQEVHPKDDD